ncbi:MAG TPA: EAL domain-containing protein [Burkholderiales bacterium]|nr:EAL domain-containing protein [Burkholderiales bacterium]
MHVEAEIEKDLTGRLLSALQEDEFILHTQAILPLVPQADGRAFNEVYVRFQEEDEKLLPPGMFLPVLEENGMLPFLDRWVVNRMARHVRAGLKQDPLWNVPRYIVNLSDETLADEDFKAYVLQYADDSYLSGGVLGFDISCTSAVANLEPLMVLMDELRPHGCSLTVAGFDSSQDVMPELKVLEPDFVKINANDVDPEELPELNRMCQEIGAQTIAEHVENTAALDRMRKCKLDFAQGFGLAKVQPLA